ncbi:hypothetical protein SARC_00580 [Sphaeroforma arctica JP610]|uniref:Uncharacterized protein n=1 Tax=Sphaeroforma arctica JP610 TaxID=667725 RepID=A0A0L0GEH7_9EUKA|nr:hypothetical protein SARC_00580 [Sphaeroforma arctica JP610]KNC87299.1 hypothetical protein SARC_00580 [Sphaeroforma arctica JP610]|eukprot:XP_014161201.1 hypothetical protein SARC_00580 [Sphaeroforma arctica JP610]
MHGVELGKKRLPMSSVVLLTVLVCSFFCTPLLLMQMYRADGQGLSGLNMAAYNSSGASINSASDASSISDVGASGVKRNMPMIRWREDTHCGVNYPLEDGSPAECNPQSKKRCCNKWGYCQLCS